jgi:hypothetical protein
MNYINYIFKTGLEKIQDEHAEDIAWRDSNRAHLRIELDKVINENRKLKEALREKEKESRQFYEKQELVAKERQEVFEKALEAARQSGILGTPKGIERPTHIEVDDKEADNLPDAENYDDFLDAMDKFFEPVDNEEIIFYHLPLPEGKVKVTKDDYGISYTFISTPFGEIKMKGDLMLREIREKAERMQANRHVKIDVADVFPCIHCGEPAYYDIYDAVVGHVAWQRWDGDNGYYCTEDNDTHAALSDEAWKELNDRNIPVAEPTEKEIDEEFPK